MEKSLSLLVDSIMEQLRPHMTQDVMLSEEWIADQIHDSRSALVPRLYAEKDIFEGWYQQVDYPSVISKEMLIDGYAYPFSEKIRIIELDTEPMANMGFKNIQFIGPVDFGLGSLLMTRQTINEFVANHHHRYGNNLPVYALYGSKILMRNVPDMEFFRTSICYANPTLVNGFTWDSPYPLPLTQHRKMEIITFQHLAPKLQMPVDLINNLQDETKNAPVANQVRQAQQEEQ